MKPAALRGGTASAVLALAGCLVLGSLGVAGCTDQATPEPAPSEAKAPAASIPPAPQVGKKGVTGAKADLTSSTCTFADGAWSFAGTLTNAQKSTQSYAVRVSVRDTTTSSVAQVKVFTEKVAAGKSVKLDEPQFFEADSAEGTDCVVSVTRKKV